MEPIISPWLVYLLGVIGGVKTTMFIAAILSAISCVIAMLIHSEMENEYGGTEPPPCDGPPKWKFIRKLIAICIIVISVNAFIPSQKTAIAMVVASQVTEDKVSAAGALVLDVRSAIKSDIVDIINYIEKEEVE